MKAPQKPAQRPPLKPPSPRPPSLLSGGQTGVLFGIDALMMVALTIAAPVFLTPANLLAVGVAMAGNVLASVGSSLVLLTGGFDLSIGSTYGLSGIVVSHALLGGIPVVPSILLALASGVGVGAVNGLIITKLRVNPFITTLGTMTVCRGLVNILTHGYSISGLPDSFTRLIGLKILGLPPSVFVMILVAVAADLLMRWWRPARQLYYIGGSPSYARLIGIKVERVTIAAYMLSGLTAAAGGLLFTMRTGAGSQQAGIGLEMLALIAPFLGGVGFGGQGTILAAFLGATLLGLIFNGIQLLGIPVLFQNVITGAFLIGAALIGMARVRRMAQAQARGRR
jgi:ribose/xylose/arabinose/galactoside ABC-type transport system permease subunit